MAYVYLWFSCLLNSLNFAPLLLNLIFMRVCVCVFLLRGVVEYDAEGFTKLTLLLMWKDFCFLVHSEYTFAMCICLEIFYCNNQGESLWCSDVALSV